jgi:hypothetical protein
MIREGVQAKSQKQSSATRVVRLRTRRRRYRPRVSRHRRRSECREPRETRVDGAVSADAILRYPPIDEATHPKRRYQTVALLLDRGANPNVIVNGQTPAEIAWFAALPDILALLRQHGAKDVDAVEAKFNRLLRASADGDCNR